MKKDVPANSTVKLEPDLRKRIERAMQVRGTKAFAEFARTSFVENCRRIEADLRTTNPAEYRKIYGDST